MVIPPYCIHYNGNIPPYCILDDWWYHFYTVYSSLVMHNSNIEIPKIVEIVSRGTQPPSDVAAVRLPRVHLDVGAFGLATKKIC